MEAGHNHLRPPSVILPRQYCQIMTTRELQETLIATEGVIRACGHLWSIKARKLGRREHYVTLSPIGPLKDG